MYIKYIVGLHRSIASAQYNMGEVDGSIMHYETAKQAIHDHAGDLVQLQAICNNVGNSYKQLQVCE